MASRTRERETRRIAGAWGLSVAVHAAALGVGAALALHSFAVPRAKLAIRARIQAPVVEIELPAMRSAAPDAPGEAPAPEGAEPPEPGGATVARIDHGRAGRGGDAHAADPALNLADRDDGMLRSNEVQSHLDRSQLQRIEAGRERRSREDWRASRDPTELTFLAMGEGSRQERRPFSAAMPSRGAPASSEAARLGARAGAAALPPAGAEAARRPGTESEGGKSEAPGSGVREGKPGRDHRAGAPTADARPMVERATPSVPAEERGKPSDNVYSPQEVALLQSLIHASGPGGVPGKGRGGETGPGEPGSGGRAGSGSQGAVLGAGGPGAPDPLSARRTDYLRRVMAKIHPLWKDAFPKWAIVEGLSGRVVVSFVIAADGSVTSASVSRPSGVAEFDENCRRAVLKAAPFEPVPPELGAALRWSMPFEARNPAVRPPDPARRRR